MHQEAAVIENVPFAIEKPARVSDLHRQHLLAFMAFLSVYPGQLNPIVAFWIVADEHLQNFKHAVPVVLFKIEEPKELPPVFLYRHHIARFGHSDRKLNLLGCTWVVLHGVVDLSHEVPGIGTRVVTKIFFLPEPKIHHVEGSLIFLLNKIELG